LDFALRHSRPGLEADH